MGTPSEGPEPLLCSLEPVTQQRRIRDPNDVGTVCDRWS